jgi:hypothetical protein
VRADENDRVHRFVEVEAIDCTPVSRRITRTASTNRVVQLPARPPSWAIGSGLISGYQSVCGNAMAIGCTKSMGDKLLHVEPFQSPNVRLNDRARRESKKKSCEAAGGYLTVAAWCFNSGAP